MENSVPKEGKSFPRWITTLGSGALDRLAAFRVIYVAIFVFVLFYVFSVKGVERLLDRHFRNAVAQAVRADPAAGPIEHQIQANVDRVVRRSPWVRIGGVRVSVLVLGADGRTPLYIGSRTVAPPPPSSPAQALREAERLLPATADVTVSVPHNTLLSNSILIGYASILLWALFVYNRALVRREDERLAAALAAREATAARAEQIERELERVRRRLAEAEPSEEIEVEEFRALQRERASLQEKLAALGQREAELRAQAGKVQELDEERRALEELLDEAMRDVAQRDEEMRTLQASLKRQAREAPSGGRARETEILARRLRTLYKNLEIDDRAISDLVGLRDETMKLKAEESLKRLSDEPETAAVRRKVGGLPPHLAIFELGFAGKGRIYYMRGDVRRFRILAVGAKNTQNADLEYLSRLA